MTELTLPPLAKPTAFDSAPPDVKEFIARHDLHEEVETAVRLAEQAFPEGSVVTLRLQFMPDRGYDWLVVEVQVPPVDLTSVLACYHNLVDLWIVEIPRPAQELIVLNFYRC